MRKNEQCVKRFLAGVLCAAFALAGMTACGNTKGAEGSVIAVSKDGTVTDTIRLTRTITASRNCRMRC